MSYTNKKRIGFLLRNQKRIMLEPNRTNAKYWCCFNDDKEFDTPSQQLVAVKEKERPQIEPNYFTNLGITFKSRRIKHKQPLAPSNPPLITIITAAAGTATTIRRVSGNNNNMSDAAATNINKITTTQRNKVKQATRLSLIF